MCLTINKPTKQETQHLPKLVDKEANLLHGLSSIWWTSRTGHVTSEPIYRIENLALRGLPHRAPNPWTYLSHREPSAERTTTQGTYRLVNPRQTVPSATCDNRTVIWGQHLRYYRNTRLLKENISFFSSTVLKKTSGVNIETKIHVPLHFFRKIYLRFNSTLEITWWLSQAM